MKKKGSLVYFINYLASGNYSHKNIYSYFSERPKSAKNYCVDNKPLKFRFPPEWKSLAAQSIIWLVKHLSATTHYGNFRTLAYA